MSQQRPLVRLQEIGEVLAEQNEMIATHQRNNKEFLEIITMFYQAAVKFQTTFADQVSPMTTVEHPPMRTEDVTRIPPAELLKRIAGAYGSVTRALQETSSELAEIYRGFDLNVNDSLVRFRNLRGAESKTQRGLAFLGTSAVPTQEARPATPETALVDRSRVDSVAASPADMLSAPTGKKNERQTNGAGPKKSSSKPLGDVLSSIASTNKSK